MKGSFFPPPDEDPADLLRRIEEAMAPGMRAELMLRHTMLGLQLATIKDLMHSNEQAEAATRIKFDELNAEIEANPDNECLYDVHEDRLWKAVFMDSAHSMSAVGMLAPFIESLFVAIFDGLRKRQGSAADNSRRQRADDQFWNPQILFDKDSPKTNLVKGISQLAVSCGLQCFLPKDYEKSLSALFAYRNNMLHNGFEWPADTTGKFSNRIASESWPEDWFKGSKTGEEPWLYCMTPEFCTHCVDLIDGIIEGVGRYLRERDG